jgi:hypothetical protein
MLQILGGHLREFSALAPCDFSIDPGAAVVAAVVAAVSDPAEDSEDEEDIKKVAAAEKPRWAG